MVSWLHSAMTTLKSLCLDLSGAHVTCLTSGLSHKYLWSNSMHLAPCAAFVIKENMFYHCCFISTEAAEVHHQLPLHGSMAAKDFRKQAKHVRQAVKAGTQLTSVTFDFTPEKNLISISGAQVNDSIIVNSTYFKIIGEELPSQHIKHYHY